MARKLYTKEFKVRAISMLEDGSRTVPELAKELDIPKTNLYSWRDM